MSGETERAPSGWTVDTLKQHFDQRFRDQEQAVAAAVTAASTATSVAMTAEQRAVAKAEAATEKRFTSVNEFRQTLSDQAATFMPRAEAENRAQANTDKIDGLTSRLDKLESRLAAQTGMLAAIAVLASLAIAFLR